MERNSDLMQDNQFLNSDPAQKNSVLESDATNNIQIPNTESNLPGLARIAFRAPPFWKNNAELWFLQLESNFVIAGISSELTKFHSVVSVLDSEVMTYVSDIVRNPPADAYSKLKSRIVNQYADSENTRLKALLQDLQLGDKKPSQLLMQMRNLAKDRVQESVLKALFLQRLPLNMQQILSVSQEGLDSLALIADKISETATDSMVVGAISDTPNLIKSLEDKISNLAVQVERLSRDRFKTKNSGVRNRSKSKGKDNSPSRRKFNPDFCWYHARFADKANCCVQPCTYSENE